MLTIPATNPPMTQRTASPIVQGGNGNPGRGGGVSDCGYGGGNEGGGGGGGSGRDHVFASVGGGGRSICDGYPKAVRLTRS